MALDCSRLKLPWTRSRHHPMLSIPICERLARLSSGPASWKDPMSRALVFKCETGQVSGTIRHRQHELCMSEVERGLQSA